MKKTFTVLAVILADCIALALTSCEPPPAGATHPGNALGWIGGGMDGWQTGIAPSQAADFRSFRQPCGVYTDGTGNIYVAESNNNRISKWNSAGQAQGWIGGGTNGWKTDDAPSAAADYQSFNTPYGVTVDDAGNIYVADCGNNRISKWNSAGQAQGWIGGGTDGWKTGDAPSAATDYRSFSDPFDVSVDGAGNIFVADRSNNRISKWNSVGQSQGWIGGGDNGWQMGAAPAPGSDYRSFGETYGVAVDSAGNIYVPDSNNSRISKWNSAGQAQGWIGGGIDGWQTGTAPLNEGTDYQSFYMPLAVAVDDTGSIYVADNLNHRICKWNSTGQAQGWIGGGTNGWQTGDAPSHGTDFRSFNSPEGVCVDGVGNIHVAEYGNNRISKWN